MNFLLIICMPYPPLLDRLFEESELFPIYLGNAKNNVKLTS